MSRSALAHVLPVEPAPLAPASALSPSVGAPLASGWQAWVDRLDAVLATSCTDLRARGHRARRITVTLRLADGRTRRRTLTLPRAGTSASDFRPAALGLLRLLVDQHPAGASRVAVALGQLVEGANQPIRFERYLDRKRTPLQRLLARFFG
ncbi:MAG: hypothetical protein JWM80_6724 [Cyanobacteria bacterium RYN_339]|nr:hypothetical protein [Cyanobacteria bacterium RYN_339]